MLDEAQLNLICSKRLSFIFFLLKPTNSRPNETEFSLFLAPNKLRGRSVTLSVLPRQKCLQGIVTPATITAKRLKIFKLNYGCLVVFDVKSEEVNPTNPSHEIQIILNHLTQVRLLKAYDRKLAVVARAAT